MNRTKQQLQRDIQFCRNVLGLTDEQTDQMIMARQLKIGAEYFRGIRIRGDGFNLSSDSMTLTISKSHGDSNSSRHQQRGTANLLDAMMFYYIYY